ncbi:MAG: hypothetical protein AAGA60_04215 [Cyanobacteria bacterium P01_E01_bin.42]
MRNKPDFWTSNERICWLCVLMEKFIHTNSLEYAPALMSGMTSIAHAFPPNVRQAIFNMRQISSIYVTKSGIKHAVALYNDYHYRKNTEGVYRIDSTSLEFERIDPLEHSNIAKAYRILSAPLRHEFYPTKTIADPRQPMSIALGDRSTSLRLPIKPISVPLPPRRTHQLQRQPRGDIYIPWSELRELAVEMDDREAQHPERRRENWKNRFDRISLRVPEIGKGLREDDAIVLEGLKHLIGLPGSGKTTLLTLIAIWLGRQNYKAMLVFPSIEVSRRYMDVLSFHKTQVGMLVGQNPITRKRHGDNIAETIASYGQGGFAWTLPGVDSFAANCVLPAFKYSDSDFPWGFGDAPCQSILQVTTKAGNLKKCLCPLWTRCGRNKAPRDLIDADIWVGHVASMDTSVPVHAIDEQIRYFELIARTFDVVIFDEADMVQANLDTSGAATLHLSGAKKSVHHVIQEQIHGRFARGENYRLFDPDVELYSRNLAEFGNYNTSLITTIHGILDDVKKRFNNQLLTVSRIVTELLDGFETKSRRDRVKKKEVISDFRKSHALTDFWRTTAYIAFYDRTGFYSDEPSADDLYDLSNVDFRHNISNIELYAETIGCECEYLIEQGEKLVHYFRGYLAEIRVEQREKIIAKIAKIFLALCFPERVPKPSEKDVIKLLVCVTFTIYGYQRIIPGTKTMIAEGLIQDSIIASSTSLDLRHHIPENVLGSLSGLRYSFKNAQSTLGIPDVELSYVTFMGAPRMLMYRFHRLLEADGQLSGPAILMTSATSFLEASPTYHIACNPHYLLKSKASETERSTEKSRYYFYWLPDSQNRGEPLRYSGAGDLRDRNLKLMVDYLVKDEKPEIYKSIEGFDVREDIYRKAALVVNSYVQARTIKQHLDRHHPNIGKRTKAVVKYLEEGDKPSDYVTSAQCEALGDDENCDIIVFPMSAIGRGVNIVFTQGKRERDAAIGSIYFLTRPHPSIDDMQLLYGLAGRETEQFDRRIFENINLTEMSEGQIEEMLAKMSREWTTVRSNIYRTARRLLQEPLMASRLGEELFTPFTANQMVAILQTIGRGMRNGCPVSVYFIDAAWAPRSAEGKTDTPKDSMLVQMFKILQECMEHPDPVINAIYRELYKAFLEPLSNIQGVEYPEELHEQTDSIYEDDDFDDSTLFEEM